MRADHVILIVHQVLEIAMNRVERLTHGWFAVRNRSTRDIAEGVDLRQRHVNERHFFTTSPWNTLPRDRTGISSLKKFLGKLLYDHIRNEFPALVQDLHKLVAECRALLDSLGAPRQTSIQQRQFLSRLAAKYQALVTNSLRGGYEPTWDPQDVRKLRMHLHAHNEDFASTMRIQGHEYAFEKIGSDDDQWLHSGSANICDWIRTSYRQARGAELHGTINPTLLEALFRQQGSPWSSIARKHLEKVDTIVSEFNRRAWSDLVPEAAIRERLQALNRSAAREASSNAAAQLDSLLRDEFDGILQTVNHYYADNIAAARAERMRDRFKSVGLEEGSSYAPDFAKLLSAAQLSNEDQAVQDIHDTLKAYYKVAIKRFTDNVVLQCVERFYIGSRGPVSTISPARIGELTDNELFDIAAEDYATSSSRTETAQRLARLERALELAEGENL